MARTRVLLGCLLLLVEPLAAQGLPEGDPDELGLSSARLQRIEQLISTAIDNEEIAGAVALVARHGRVAFLEAFGMADIDDRESMETDTIFRIASMTKPVTSLAVMMLHEEGHFLLRDPVSRFIPQFRDPRVLISGFPVVESRPAEGEITIPRTAHAHLRNQLPVQR